MKRIPCFLFLSTTSLCNYAKTAATGPDCYSSLSPIADAEEALSDDSELRTYILCPHTRFPIATNFDTEGKPVRGQHPLILGRSNVHVLCGEDGSSDNICILEGGLFQVGFVDDFESNKPANNTKIQGLTLKDAKSVNLLAQFSGDLTVEDCVFRDNQNVSPVYISLPRNSNHNRRHRSLITKENFFGDESRLLDESNHSSDSPLMNINMVNCIFLDNVIWPLSSSSSDGIVSILSKNANVTISHTSFVGTRMENNNLLPYHICLLYGTLTLEDNCFVGGDSRISNVVNEQGTLNDNRSFVQSRAETLPMTRCEYRADVTEGSLITPASGLSFDCRPPDSSVCTSASISRVVNLPCLESLDVIATAEESIENTEFTRTYILCPHTTYHLQQTTLFDADEAVSGTSSLPITVGRPNVHILCGATGSSEEGCMISGGESHLLVKKMDDNVSVTNAFVSGITFANAKSGNVHVQTDSSLHLRDCIFENTSNLAAITLSGTLVDDVKVKISESLFWGSSIRTLGGRSSGVITNIHGSLEVNATTFMNIFDATNATQVGYVIGSVGGSIALNANCFINNDVSVSPVLVQGGKVEESLNYGENSSIPGRCGFVTLSDTVENMEDFSDSNENVYCREFSAHQCLGVIPPLHDHSINAKPYTPSPTSLGSGVSCPSLNGTLTFSLWTAMMYILSSR